MSTPCPSGPQCVGPLLPVQSDGFYAVLDTGVSRTSGQNPKTAACLLRVTTAALRLHCLPAGIQAVAGDRVPLEVP